MSKYLLIDGYNLAFRSYYALPELTRDDGFPTGALHGWVKSLWRLQDLEHPTASFVFFDLGGSQDRLAIHPEYKAQRAPTPDALKQQIPLLKEVTAMMGFTVVEKEGVESDDLLAAQAVACAKEGHEIRIVSSDKDFAQIVNDRIQILLPPPSANPKLGWRTLNPEGVKEKFGVPPEQIPDYLALIGDSSDNIPGLPGVGPKTAVKLLQQHPNIEALISNAATIAPPRIGELIANNTELLRLNLKLITLNLSLPTCSEIKPDTVNLPALIEFLDTYQLKAAHKEALTRYQQAELF